MRLLGLDIGDKRTGLALADVGSDLVSPLDVIESPLSRPDDLARAIAREVERQRPDELVVGLPLNEDGSDSAQAKKVRGFLDRSLRSVITLPIRVHDERLTTDAAHWAMAGSGLTHKQKKGRRDAIAAAEILRDYLNVRRAAGGPGPPPPTA